MRYDFDWDSKKAETNARKHKISFERATTVFGDSNAISIPDEEHSKIEERLITLGILLVVIHTFICEYQEFCAIRLISARKATKKESWVYYDGTLS